MGSVFDGDDVNKMFNSFLNTFTRIFYSGFPLTNVNKITTYISWIASGIKISCKRKRKLYRGGGKSLARPERKQANVSVRMG